MPDRGISEQTIAVAMSGGVDSSVVAGLLQSQGEQVIGLTMQLVESAQASGDAGRGCDRTLLLYRDVYDARHVAQHLGIPYYVVNFEQRFEEQVVKPFVADYLAGPRQSPARSVTTTSSLTSFWKWRTV